MKPPKWRQNKKIKRTQKVGKKYRSGFCASNFGSKTTGKKISPPQLSTTGKFFSASATSQRRRRESRRFKKRRSDHKMVFLEERSGGRQLGASDGRRHLASKRRNIFGRRGKSVSDKTPISTLDGADVNSGF